MTLRHNISLGVSKSLFLSFIVKVECNSAVTLLWENKEKKNELKIHYHIQEWNKFTKKFDILQNQFNYPTVCLLLDTAQQTDHCITVCGK